MKGTSPAVVEKIAAAYKASLDNPETVKKIENLGSMAVYMGPAEFKKFLDDQDVMYKATFAK